MQKIRFFLMICIVTCSLAAAFAEDPFNMDQNLVNTLKENKIRLIVMRQPEAINNLEKILSSSRSPGFALTLNGIVQSNDLVPFFSTQNIFKIFTSPLYRCLQTTHLLGENLTISALDLVVDDRLLIQQFGIYEGFPYSVYNALFPTLPAMLEAELEGMESGLEVFQRTNALLWDIANNMVDKTVLIVTHAFNFCHISKCLTDAYGKLPYPGVYAIYDFIEEHTNILTD
jgi:broad specificity phosphatase PhoE